MNILKKLWAAAGVKPAVWALLKAIVTAVLTTVGVSTLSGCGTLQRPSSTSQSSTICALGVPAVIVSWGNEQFSDNTGDDKNEAFADK